MKSIFLRRLRYVVAALALLAGPTAVAQVVPAMPQVALDTVVAGPQAVDISGWLLLNKDIQTELDGAVHNLYNYKFDKADRQFRSLRRRYPNHPMAYFLLGLSTWWKMMPNAPEDTRYDKMYYAYLDTAETKALAMYKADSHNYEACFFLSAAYGFEARLHSERHNWRKATVASKRALDYLHKSREANGLSSEFELGYGLFDYYAVWIGDEYPWLRPVLFFFPKGDTRKGLAELRNTSKTAFYARPEALFFLVLILRDPREHQVAQALAISRELSREYPDNSRFQIDYAKLCFDQGSMKEAEAECLSTLQKNAAGYVGYGALTCRTAAYIMGYINQYYYKNQKAAMDYYQRSIVFSETVGMTESGYYIFSNAALAKLAAQANDVATAQRFYRVVVDKADHKEIIFKEARLYLIKHKE